MTDAERDDTIRSLFAIRVQVDGLLARLQPTSAPPTKTGAAPVDARPKPTGCQHPKDKRDREPVFGSGPSQFWCRECQTMIEGEA